MPLTLHEAVVPNWLQMLDATLRLLDKAGEWAEAEGLQEADLLEARLAGDMLPLAYQFKSCWVHTALAIEGCRKGVFAPHTDPAPLTMVGLRERLHSATATLQVLDPQELEELAAEPMEFAIGERRMAFTVQNFLLSFATPNAYFHAATAYGILRMRGMPIGKRDFLGRPRMTTS